MTDQSGRREPTVEDLRQEQRDEVKGGTYPHTPGQVHGAVLGAIVFGAIALVVSAVISLLVFSSDSPARFVVPIVVTVFAGWAGLVYWGGRAPEIEEETTTIYGEPEDGTTMRETERGR